MEVLTVSSRAWLSMPLRLLCRKALELPVLEIRILASRPISHNGFIEIRLRNVRRSLQDDQRRYQRKRGRTANKSGGSIIVEMPEEGEEAASEWKTMIKRMRPSQENITIIKEGMEKTYAYRRLWITSSSPTVEDIFAEYPRFVDMPYLVSETILKVYSGI